MPTKWTNKLSDAQLYMLLIVAGRQPRFNLVRDRCKKGIVVPFADESRTVKALVKRGLVRWVWAHKDNVPSNGITLTQEGADTLVPSGPVTWPEKTVHVPQLGAVLRVNLPGHPNVRVPRADYVDAKTAQLREFGYDALTSEQVNEQISKLLEGKKTLAEGLTVIGKMMENEIIGS
jgi:hypothetical protein